MGCSASKLTEEQPTGGPGAPGSKQVQSAESEKDAAAAEIQASAAKYLADKKKDIAAADIQNAAAGFLAQKRAEEKKKSDEPEGWFASMFSQRKDEAKS